ncbi:MAG: hypothetical protein EPO68_06835 [Planctomycetota bacterium]|nr:MAG: hypothetical protein EPO68_06835 [Planctomycetota bacterium]
MWELPTRERAARGSEPRLWPTSYAAPLSRARIEREPLARLRHSITTHRITIEVRAAKLASELALDVESGAPLAWVRARELERYALTGMTRKALVPLTAARAARRRASSSAARTPR